MPRMLRWACSRSAIVIRSDSERKRAEITAGRCCEIEVYFLMSSDFKTTVWRCRHRVPELRLIPTMRQASELPIPVSSADHSEPVQRSSVARPGPSAVFSSLPIATPNRSGVATTARRQAVAMAQFSTVTDTVSP
jgi:hypothetical protein